MEEEAIPLTPPWQEVGSESFPIHPKMMSLSELERKLPPIRWHKNLAPLYVGTVAGIYRRRHEAFLRLLARQRGREEILRAPSLIQPHFALLDQVRHPKDIIAVTAVLSEKGKPPFTIMLIENRSPQIKVEESVGKTAISEALVGLPPLHEVLKKHYTHGACDPEEIGAKIKPFSSIRLGTEGLTGVTLLTGNMTFIGLKDGRLVALPIVGQQEDWQWDLARSGLRRILEKYNRHDEPTRLSQIALAEKIAIPPKVLASNNQVYPINWVIILNREDLEEVACEWGDFIQDPQKIINPLGEQLMANPAYHTSGHWALNHEEHKRRTKLLTDPENLTHPPMVSFLHLLRTRKYFPVVKAASMVLSKAKTLNLTSL